jgi:Txe/YoeB family toxin of Txe-Axe toxin-antitoxin module
MEIAFTDKAKEHLAEWKISGNKAVMKKIETLLTTCKKHRLQGLASPKN